jgi:hypothetical protein
MAKRLPVNVVQGMGLLWLLSTPLYWLGSAISKMDTPDRYKVQLAAFSIVCVLAIAACFGTFAFAIYRWARAALIVLSWSAAAFWLDSGYHLLRSGYVLPLVIGVSYAGMAFVLHQTVPHPSRQEWATA